MICALRPTSIVRIITALSFSALLFGQFRGSSDWSTHGSDAQRTSWIRTDPKISPTTVTSSTFQLLWKVKLGNEPLSAPVLLDRYIGYRGFRTYAFVGSSAGDAYALDSDLGKIEWQKHLASGTKAGSASCPAGMTAALTRPVSGALPGNAPPRFGGGRGGPAKSGVGSPMNGAVTLAQVATNVPPPTPPAANSPTGPPPRPLNNPFTPRPTLMFALSGDGSLHSLYVSNGEEAAPPIPFLAEGAHMVDFSVVDNIAYATTTGHCGGTADGVWALDLTSKAVSKWEGSANAPAFGPAGAYVASEGKLVALDLKALTSSASYDAGASITTTPVVFEYKSKTLAAAASKDGVIHLADTASLTTAVAKSPANDTEPFALATWQTVAETRWLIAAGAKSITAWKLVDQNGKLEIQQAWTVKDLVSPAAPLIINGVLFALERGDKGQHAKLFAFDASTGKPIWNSGNTVTSFVSKSGGLAAGGSALYFGTHDGTLWSFGFPIEH